MRRRSESCGDDDDNDDAEAAVGPAGVPGAVGLAFRSLPILSAAPETAVTASESTNKRADSRSEKEQGKIWQQGKEATACERLTMSPR